MEQHGIETKVFVREAIFGFNDGLVSMFALVIGIAAATSASHIVVLSGLIGAISGAISMALGTYISNKSQIEVYNRELQREKDEIETVPDTERQEIRDIYRKKGFRGKDLEMVVKKITSSKKIWLKVMMKEELGLTETSYRDSKKAAMIIFFAFIIGAIIPIMPFVLITIDKAVLFSIITSMCGLFAVGAIKSRLTKLSWAKSGLEMVIIGGLASIISFGFGMLASTYLGTSVI